MPSRNRKSKSGGRRRSPRRRTSPAKGPPADDLAAVTKAAEGLTYPSETDAPFDPTRWEGDGTPEELAIADAQARGGKPAPVEWASADDFFGELQGTSHAERFAALRRALESCLSDLQVVRVGERQVHVYLVGRPAGGGWAGLHTVSVET